MPRIRCVPGARVFGLLAALCSGSLLVAACAPRGDSRGELSPEALYARDAELASARLSQRIPSELLADNALFLYVDESDSGPLAQHMVVFAKGAGGSMDPVHVWPVSTGRGDTEVDARGKQQSTSTPEGLFALDPKRMYARYKSSQWDETMPFAMFLSDPSGSPAGGLAIHAAAGEGIDRIGTPASAGCIRLAPENAHTLFDLVRTQSAGEVSDLGGVGKNTVRTATKHGRRDRPKHAPAVIVLIDRYPSQAFASLNSP